MITRFHSSKAVIVLVALALSLIVNFSYLLLLVANPSEIGYVRRESRNAVRNLPTKTVEGVYVSIPDGYGYIVAKDGDSTFVSRYAARRLGLKDGERIKAEAVDQPEYDSPHYALRTLLERDGVRFDYASLYDKPSQVTETIYQVLFYFVFALMLLLIMNGWSAHKSSWKLFSYRTLLCIALGVALYFVAPITMRRTNQTILLFQSTSLFDPVVIFKCLFVVVVVILYSDVYKLTHQQNIVILENEQLKNENLLTKYNMLVSQINPHFLFNSLSSLSMLVREGDKDKSLKYIDQLSYTFRYITQNGQQTQLVPLKSELDFLEAYCYLFQIRYGEKISFSIEIEKNYENFCLPALSLQPLIGNIVKHNEISAKKPMKARIFLDAERLCVENPIHPILSKAIGTGTGLSNLQNRYRLTTQKEIEIMNDGNTFKVYLPLIKA
ncbi:MAG: histidine kinase [Alistipes sp.]|nr:histidine kinase [Candidatus Alistipes equi]